MRHLNLTLTVFFISICSLQAQTYEWKGLLHGLHPIQLEVERKGIWATGKMYAASDTFIMEGSWNDGRIELLEFHDGLWTAKLILHKTASGVSGHWIPRIDSNVFYVELEKETPEVTHYYYLESYKENYQDIHLSPTSGLDCFGHVFKEDELELKTFYINSYGGNTAIGLNDSSLNMYISRLLQEEKDPEKKGALQKWPVRQYAESNYHSLIEVLHPITSDPKVNAYLEKWKKDFLNVVRSQKIDLPLGKDENELDKTRWAWNAHAYVEVYSKSEKCWSFALHTFDLKGKTEVSSLHYFPSKKEIFLLQGEINNWSRLEEVIGKKGVDWEEVVFHPEGLITIRPFKPEHGIQRDFYPDKQVRRFYRLFSPLKWIK